jgi:hypothetical protein
MFFRFAGAKVQSFFDSSKYLCDFFAFSAFYPPKWCEKEHF